MAGADRAPAPMPAGLRTVRTLLERAIDYAGLFPPARLAMAPAVRRFAEYRAGEDAWALGRFVVPAAQLGELSDAAAPLLPRALPGGDVAAAPWHLSVLLGTELDEELALVAGFNDRHRRDSELGHAVVDTVELRASSADEASRVLDALPGWLHAFVEIPAAADPAPVLAALAPRGAGAKLRTGGVVADAFPRPERVVRFLRACAEAGVPCKLTAGLHHAVCGDYPLTYDSGSPRGRMFGFVPVLLAAAWLRAGRDEAAARALLTERSASSITFAGEEVRWRGERLSLDEVTAARTALLRSFGSCSFDEPMAELRALGWL